MKKDLFRSLLCSVLFLGSTGLIAQTINGTVSSEDGPLPGATVQVQGTDQGVSTDFDGNFSIEAGADDVLIVSFVGALELLKTKTRSMLMFLAAMKAEPMVLLASELLLIKTPTSL